MSNTPHELYEEFPDRIEVMHRLKLENAHFAKLFDEYHAINDAIHRAESNIEPTDALTEQTMRKERLLLKDEIWGMLQAE
ncbi:MAG: YdcH family protein [Rhodobacterales bacterium]